MMALNDRTDPYCEFCANRFLTLGDVTAKWPDPEQKIPVCHLCALCIFPIGKIPYDDSWERANDGWEERWLIPVGHFYYVTGLPHGVAADYGLGAQENNDSEESTDYVDYEDAGDD